MPRPCSGCHEGLGSLERDTPKAGSSNLRIYPVTSMQAYYQARAREYDRVYDKPERQPDLRKIEAWLPTVLAGKQVLEVACGTGYWTQFFAPVARAVTGIDSAPETLDIARSRLPSNVSLQQGDAYDLERIAGEFDAAFAGFWWSHIPLRSLPQFLESLHRKLGGGATVVFIDNRFVPGSSTAISETDGEGNTFQQRQLEDGSTYRVLKNFASADQLMTTVAPYAASCEYSEWPHFWALTYTLR